MALSIVNSILQVFQTAHQGKERRGLLFCEFISIQLSTRMLRFVGLIACTIENSFVDEAEHDDNIVSFSGL